MKQATLCALACLLFAWTPADALSAVKSITLGYTPILTPPTSHVRRWDGTFNAVTEASLRSLVTEEGDIKIRGKRQRKKVRHVRWMAGLAGDRLSTMTELGYPNSRYLERSGDRVQELWTYPEQHTQFIFEGDALVSTRLH